MSRPDLPFETLRYALRSIAVLLFAILLVLIGLALGVDDWGFWFVLASGLFGIVGLALAAAS